MSFVGASPAVPIVTISIHVSAVSWGVDIMSHAGACKSLFLWPVLPPRDLKLDGGKPSAGAMSLKEIIGLEGVELGADGKVRRLPGFWPLGLC